MKKSFFSDDEVKHSLTYTQLLLSLWPYCRKYLYLFLLSIFCVVSLAVCSRLLPTVIGWTIESGFVKKDLSAIYQFALVYLALELSQSFFQFSYSYFFARFGNRIIADIRRDLVEKTQNLPLQFFNKNPTGRIITRLTHDPTNLAEIFSDGVISIVAEIAILVSIVVAMAMISPQIAFYVLLPAPIFILLSLMLSKQIKEILRESKRSLARLSSFVSENLNGIKTIQLYNQVDKNQKRFSQLSLEYRDLNLSSIRTYARQQPNMNLFNAVTITGALLWVGTLGNQSGLAVGSLIAFILHAQDIIPPLREILEKYQRLQNSLTSGERILHQLEESPETNQKSKTTQLGSLKGEIEFKKLNFRYEEQLPFVFQNLDLKIKAGSRVAIVGRTGSGKTTLISLLQRLYPTPSGSILLDGHDIQDFALEDLRRRVVCVQQDPFLFKASIAENIHLLDPEITQKAVELACQRIGLDQFLSRRGKSLNDPVDERGQNLSAGERQLVSFARIIAFDPEILILDEATAQIDSETEAVIEKAMTEASQGRTSIIVAHRISTVKSCDQIFVLDQGKLIEHGNFLHLMSLDGKFAQMARSTTELLA